MEINKKEVSKNNTLPLTLSALGVVYGDLGTSPLYALQQTIPYISLNNNNILGILSLVFWSLILVISTVYVTVFLRASNDGEGGILSLVSLLKRQRKFPRSLFLIGVLGAGLLLADGMLTPAISVISAIEGLKIISPNLSDYITPISLLILFLLYFSQHLGTAKIGFVFGPILLCWFIIIGILGGLAIVKNPTVLHAINPYYAFHFLYNGGWPAYILLSGVFLVITGAEAMYTDLGQFGRVPIRIGWFAIVLPSLLLNYFGQGANLLLNSSAISNLFYSLAPDWFLYPLLIISTLATIIASQGVITAGFSLAKQAILLNIFPRLSIIHTSENEKGQVYVPQINFVLATGTLLLVAIFKNSSSLAAAFGMSVNLVMIIVAILVMFVARRCWKWSIVKVLQIFSIIFIIDLAFLGANLHKIFEGAWIPLAVAILSAIIMLTWDKGVRLIQSCLSMNKKTLPEAIKGLDKSQLHSIDELSIIFMTDPEDKTGDGFIQYLKLNHILPKEILIVNIIIDDFPYVNGKNQYEIDNVNQSIYYLKLHYGFMQSINVPAALNAALKSNIFPFLLDIKNALYLVEEIGIIMTKRKFTNMFYWQKKLFLFLLRNSSENIEFYQLPYQRTITIGSYCDI